MKNRQKRKKDTYRHIQTHIFKGKKENLTERKTDRQIEHKTFVHSWVKQYLGDTDKTNKTREMQLRLKTGT